MLIRPIEQRDNIPLAKIIRAVLTEHGVNRPGTVFTDPTTDQLYELFQKPNSAYFVVEVDGELIGGCGIYPTTGLDSSCVELVKLYLTSSSRGLGIGRQLMEICTEEAKRLGYKSLYLESMPELNSALSLYGRQGFEMLDGPMGNSGHFSCDVWMVKKLR